MNTRALSFCSSPTCVRAHGFPVCLCQRCRDSFVHESPFMKHHTSSTTFRLLIDLSKREFVYQIIKGVNSTPLYAVLVSLFVPEFLQVTNSLSRVTESSLRVFCVPKLLLVYNCCPTWRLLQLFRADKQAAGTNQTVSHACT